MTKDPAVRFLSKAAAHYLGVSRSTLAKWRTSEKGPPHHRLGDRLVYYFKHDIDIWLDDCDRQPAAKASRTSRR